MVPYGTASVLSRCFSTSARVNHATRTVWRPSAEVDRCDLALPSADPPLLLRPCGGSPRLRRRDLPGSLGLFRLTLHSQALLQNLLQIARFLRCDDPRKVSRPL